MLSQIKKHFYLLLIRTTSIQDFTSPFVIWLLQLIQCLSAWNAKGLEPWLAYLLGLAEDPQSLPITESNQFIKRCEENGIPASRLYLQYER